MLQKNLNPWTWQDKFGFSQAVEVTGARRLLFCAGQTALDADGKVIAPGDMRGQMRASVDNLEIVLAAAGLSLANIVRLNYFTTDIPGFRAHNEIIKSRLRAAGCQPSSTLLGISQLAYPELLIEIEATAVE